MDTRYFELRGASASGPFAEGVVLPAQQDRRVALLTLLGAVSSTHRSRMATCESLEDYAREHFAPRMASNPALRLWLHLDDYNNALRVYGGHTGALALDVETVSALRHGPPDLVRTLTAPLAPDVFAVLSTYGAEGTAALQGFHPRTFLAVRTYLEKEDPHYLREGDPGDVGALLARLAEGGLLERVGPTLYVPVQVWVEGGGAKRRRGAPRRPHEPSFDDVRATGGLHLTAPTPPTPVLVVHGAPPPGASIVVFDDKVRRRVGGAMYSEVKAGPHHTVCFVVQARRDVLFLTTARHFLFTNLSRVEGFAHVLRAEGCAASRFTITSVFE
jgi:hypothetical protein